MENQHVRSKRDRAHQRYTAHFDKRPRSFQGDLNNRHPFRRDILHRSWRKEDRQEGEVRINENENATKSAFLFAAHVFMHVKLTRG